MKKVVALMCLIVLALPVAAVAYIAPYRDGDVVRWENDEYKIGSSTVYISKNDDYEEIPSNPIVEEKVTGNSYRFNLDAGIYYFMVVTTGIETGGDETTDYSETLEIVIEPEPKPVIEEKEPVIVEEVIEVEEQEPEVEELDLAECFVCHE